MDSVEAEGSSIDDAIQRALHRLGVSRDKVDIEILSNATRGLFGLGGKRAKVRASLRPALGSAPEPGDGHAGTRAEQRPAAAAPAAASEPRRAPRPDRRPPPPRRDRPPSARAVPDAPPAEAVVERARAALAEIVRLTGVAATVSAQRDGDAVRLLIDGDPSGVLIGRRGQTLDAIEYVINRIVLHEEEAAGRLIVDAQDYRVRRRQSLEALAQRMAERARRRGKPVSLAPMSPRDRRTVHLALQGDPTLTTRSAGDGYYRKLVIVPKRPGG